MSYDIELCDPLTGTVMLLPEKHELRGGTYCLGGTTRASLNVTYNYGRLYYDHFPGERGIRTIYGMTGAESVPVLQDVIARLGNDPPDSDYWTPTEANARRALEDLLTLARAAPHGVWSGD